MLRARLDDLGVLVELAEEEDDAGSREEAVRDLGALKADIEALEVRTLLSGEYDSREAVVTIRSGAGGVDAADWAEMLMRMYIRWAEGHGYGVEVYDTSYAEEAAAALGVDPGIVFKTLVAQVDGGPVLTLVPTDAQLDLKALAAALGGARAQLAEPALAERLTGYVVGGISALGTRRPLPTVADESLAAVPTVYLSAGKRGLQVSLSSADLLRIAEARLAAIARRR